jgi:hypothetical protein
MPVRVLFKNSTSKSLGLRVTVTVAQLTHCVAAVYPHHKPQDRRQRLEIIDHLQCRPHSQVCIIDMDGLNCRVLLQ